MKIALLDIHKPITVAEYKLLLSTKELEVMIMIEIKNTKNEQQEEVD